MNLEWYSFDYSYLLSIDYRPTDCSLEVGIEARMSVDHPKSKIATSFEDLFEEISVVFRGVQYVKLISSLNILNDPNDDHGNIEHFSITSGENNLGLVRKRQGDKITLSVDLLTNKSVEIFSKTKGLQFAEFISEMIAFEVGFEQYDIDLKSSSSSDEKELHHT